MSLIHSNYLERKLSGTFREWHMRFRAKDKYIYNDVEKSI